MTMSALPAAADSTSGRYEYRYERKFTATAAEAAVDHIVRRHPAAFREAYPPRWINNVYFDSPALRSVHDNLDGVADRIKTRIRWYGDLAGRAERPALERKIKRGLVGRKIIHPLPPLSVSNDLRLEGLAAVIAASSLPAALHAALRMLRPTLVNRYRRQYFRTADGAFRLTVDTHLEYFAARRVGHGRSPGYRDRDAVVLELKYARAADGAAGDVTRHIPFRVSRSSKYVTGMGRVYGPVWLGQ